MPTSPAESLRDGNTGVRTRTQQAILDAAVSLWSRDFTLALGDIAEAARVSRSTLHRYFPDRAALVDGAYGHALHRIEEASAEATRDASTAAEKLEGLMRASIEAGEAVIFLFSDQTRFNEKDGWDASLVEGDPETADLIRQAQSDGALAADVDPSWSLGVFYSLVYVAAESIAQGASRRRATRLAVRTFFHGLGPA